MVKYKTKKRVIKMNILKKRKRILLTVLLSWFFLIGLVGQEKSTKTGKSFIWEIRTKAGNSYLLGSLHVLKKESYPLQPAIEDAFTNTTSLVVEANLSQDKMMEVAALAFKKGVYAGDETLKDNLSEKTYNLAKQRLAEKGMDIELFEKTKPWMLAITIAGMEIMKLGFDPNYGIDKYFLDRASGKKEILELEGVDFQVNLLDSFSAEESDKFLFSTLQETGDYREELDKMVAAWEKGDAALMADLVDKSTREFPELKDLNKRLIDDRNHTMLEKILSFFKEEKTYLVVVGAGHLVGKTGLVQLLKDKGFTLKQL